MMKSLLSLLLAVGLTPALTLPAAAESLMAPRVAPMELSATPLLSRNLHELGVARQGSKSTAPVQESAAFGYQGEGHGLAWLIDTFIEPLYLSLLGASLLLLGTFKRRGS